VRRERVKMEVRVVVTRAEKTRVSVEVRKMTTTNGKTTMSEKTSDST
jgi:hypothetical protein